MDEPRILTEDETYARHSQQAAGNGPGIVALCAAAGCPRAAAGGPWCVQHRPRPEPGLQVVGDFTPDEYAAIGAQVEADAAPLFVLAMSWIARQQLANLDLTVDSFEASVDRIRGELEARP